jgi:hypothetical protein
MRVTSHTLPIWSMRRAWKLLVHLLIIVLLPSWWWSWRVEGLLVLHLLLPVVVVLMSRIGKLVLIHRWQSSLQGGNPIDDSSNRTLHLLKSCVSGLWFFLNSSLIAFSMAWTSLLLTHSSSLSPAGGGAGGGCPYFGGIVNRKQRATQLVIG